MSNDKLRKVEESFSERLKMLRKGRGWSQEDLATRLDVSPGSVGNWEMGPHEPHPRTLNKMAALFEVDVPYLLRGEKEEPAATMREGTPEYKATDLGALLREIEDARDGLDRVAQQLRKVTGKPSPAATLTEIASANYDQKRGGGKTQPKETVDSDARRIVIKAESSHSK
jgi:transcriptional regulator with XRE-family HTH domain